MSDGCPHDSGSFLCPRHTNLGIYRRLPALPKRWNRNSLASNRVLGGIVSYSQSEVSYTLHISAPHFRTPLYQ